MRTPPFSNPSLTIEQSTASFAKFRLSASSSNRVGASRSISRGNIAVVSEPSLRARGRSFASRLTVTDLPQPRVGLSNANRPGGSSSPSLSFLVVFRIAVRKRDEATDIAPRHAIFGQQLIKASARRLAFLIVASKHKLGTLANLLRQSRS